MNYTKLFILLGFLGFFVNVNAQTKPTDPVEWKFYYKRINANQIALIFEAEIQPGWSMPAQQLVVSSNDNSDSVEVLNLNRMDLTLQLLPNRNTRCVEKLKASHVPKTILGAAADKDSPNLNYYEKKVKFVQLLQLKETDKTIFLRGSVYYNWLHPKELKHGEERMRDQCFCLTLTPNEIPILYVGQSCEIMHKAPRTYKVEINQ